MDVTSAGIESMFFDEEGPCFHPRQRRCAHYGLDGNAVVRDDDMDAVVAAALQGDRAALTALYRSVNPSLLRYLRAKEPAAADDLAGDTWEAAVAGLHRFEGGGDDFRAWLFTIARRRVSDRRRQMRRRRTDVVAVDVLDGRPDTNLTDAIVVDRLSAQQAIDRLVHQLPPLQAEVVLLRVVAGLSVDQVSRMLRCSPGAVRVLQHRGLKRLAERLAPIPVTP